MSVPQSRLSPRALIYWEARQAHAQQRIQDGATLTPAEREALVALLPAGVPTAGLPEAVAEVDYNSAFYWHSILLVPRSNPAPALRGLASDAAKLAQKLAATPRSNLVSAADASAEWCLLAIPPELLRALEDGVPEVLRVLEQGIPEFSPPLHRPRAVGFEHHGGGRVEIMQHAIEQLEVCALAAAEQTPPPRRAKGDEPELRRLIEKLRLVWTERLGLPYQPYARKRKGTGAFIKGAIAIIDPHVRAGTIAHFLPPKQTP